MPRINLLPWREELRLQKNKEFITLVIMIALLALLAVGATLFFFNNRLDDQKAANELIISENQKLDNALKEIATLEQRKEEIIARMKVIQDLQGKRPIPVRVWDDLARAVPEMLFLTKLERKGNQLILSGKAENPNIVSTLINNLNRSQWMGNSSVQFIEKGEDTKIPDKKSKEIIYPEDSYVSFQVSTTIQMSVNGNNTDKTQGGAINTVTTTTTFDNGQPQEQQAPTVPTADEPQAQATTTANSEVQSQETATANSDAEAKGSEETKPKSEEPQKESDNSANKAPVKQDNAKKSQTSDNKQNTGEDNTSNASQDGKAKSSDDTAKDSGGESQ